VRTGRATWTSDIAAPGRPSRYGLARTAGLTSSFELPVLAGRDVVAVLEFFATGAIDPDETFVEVMSQIGAQLGRVIERQRAEELLTHNALHDNLTGLPNRILLLDRLTTALARAKRQADLAVLFLDLDRFKLVNDSLGHEAGDRLLVATASRLSAAVREGDTIARFGGDEFVVLCEDVGSVEEAILVADRISAALATPIALDGGEVFVTTSIGIALSSGAQQTAHALLRDADAALYRAKETARGSHEVFNEDMRSRATRRLETVNALHRAIERDELLLHYQPVVALGSGETVGMEALVRWMHPERGLVPPAEFIPLAEESGIIAAVGRWVLREACRQRREWIERIPGAARLTIGVNLSPRELHDPSLVDEVAEVIAGAGIDPWGLVFEVTESVLMSDAGVTIQRIEQLKKLGVRIAIDDFGTGYSSLASLRRLPVDVLKIDKSFIDGLDKDPEKAAIACTVVRLAQALGLRTIAEGVEHAEVARALGEFGCDLAQGYYFARPLVPDAMEWRLREEFAAAPARDAILSRSR